MNVSVSKSPPVIEPDILRESIQLMLAGMRRHVVVADTAAANAFTTALAQLEERLRKTSDLRQVTRAVLGLLEGYSRQANQAIDQQRSELGRLVSELTATMASMPEVDQMAEPILALEQQVAAISSVTELESFRRGISEALGRSRANMLRVKQSVSDLISGSIARIRKADQGSAATAPAAGTPAPAAGASDQLTGLPTRAFAEAEIARLHAQLPDAQAALFVVRRLKLINRKFGFSRGDQVLQRVVQHLTQELPNSNNFFRWTSSSFLILTSPAVSTNQLRAKVQQLGLHRLTLTLEWEGHTALVPISFDTRIISLSEFPSADAIYQALDAIVLD